MTIRLDPPERVIDPVVIFEDVVTIPPEADRPSEPKTCRTPADDRLLPPLSVADPIVTRIGAAVKVEDPESAEEPRRSALDEMMASDEELPAKPPSTCRRPLELRLLDPEIFTDPVAISRPVGVIVLCPDREADPNWICPVAPTTRPEFPERAACPRSSADAVVANVP